MNKQQGIGAFDLMVVLLLAGMALYYLMIVPYQNTQVVNEIRSKPPSITAEDKRLIDSFKAKPEPKIFPSGKYYGEGEVDGKEYKITYYFGDDQTVTKEMSILDEYRLGGSAKYHYEGSAIVFSEIVGDRFLFPEIGEAVSVPNISMMVRHDATYPIHLKSSALIEQEKREADKAASERREMIESKSILDLSPEEVIEKVAGSGHFPFVIFFLIVPALLIAFQRFYQRQIRRY